ncbi:MAG: outer membrane protein assembly factor BamA [Planctomycetota bacterium]
MPQQRRRRRQPNRPFRPGPRLGVGGAFALCPSLLVGVVGMAGAALMPAAPAWAQGVDPSNRPVAAVRVTGLREVPEALVRNAIRLQPGGAYDAERVQADVQRITRLGRFSRVVATVADDPEGGGVIVTYELQEQPLLRSVELRGVKSLEESDLRDAIVIQAGDPADVFLIERARRQIVDAYEAEGFFRVQVSFDEARLEDERELVFIVVEGPRVRVRDIRFEGNEVFPSRLLKEEVRQPEYFPIFRKAHLDQGLLTLDAARVRGFMQARGYLDAQVDRRIDISPDQREAVVTFVVNEGSRYTVSDIRFISADGEPLIFTDTQLLLAMDLKPGSVFSEEAVARSRDAIQNLYGKLGYLGTAQTRLGIPEPRIDIARRFAPDAPQVRLDVTIEQGQPTTVGKMIVRGNDLTQTRVVLREVRGMTPGRRFDRTGVERTVRRLNESPLFRGTSVTILGDPEQEVRDVLIEVSERNTGSIAFGANLSSDLGIGAAVDINQRNFDILDFPDSFNDFTSGRAFRGGGQVFDLTLSPGAENSTYSISWRDPAFLDSDFSLGLSAFITDRERDDFDEGRDGATVRVGRRFGDVWSGSVGVRYTFVEIDDVDEDEVITDVLEVEGASDLTAIEINLRRSTTDSNIEPSRGSRLDLGVEQVGVFGGDFDFTRVSAGITKFWTVDEDFLNRKTIVMASLSAANIIQNDEAPIFERFFAGGRSFRGFQFRGVGPRGIVASSGLESSDPAGGEFSLLGTLQYEFPLVDNFLRGVVFTDQGTVQDTIGVDEWRITVGTGLRMKVPFLSQAPFAVDLAVPILDEEGDEAELISFTLDIPFR